MASVYGVTGSNIAIEFAKSRGAIHYHNILYSRHQAMSQCSEASLACATTISTAMKQVNVWIENSYDPWTHSELSPVVLQVTSLPLGLPPGNVSATELLTELSRGKLFKPKRKMHSNSVPRLSKSVTCSLARSLQIPTRLLHGLPWYKHSSKCNAHPQRCPCSRRHETD